MFNEVVEVLTDEELVNGQGLGFGHVENSCVGPKIEVGWRLWAFSL
jgi:hypothetical protein